MRVCVSFLLSFFLALPCFAEAERPKIHAAAACLLDRASGRILFRQNENEKLPMASTTKILTGELALEALDPEQLIETPQIAAGVEGTSLYLSAGEVLTARQLLQGLILRSGNDAAVALAVAVDGSVEKFAERMNARALELGADAHFVNPHGLDAPGHEASALGMAKIAADAMDNPAFRDLVGAERALIPWEGNAYRRVLTNKNKLLKTYPGATGVKIGFTKKAGRCLVFSAQRDGMELVGALLNCANWFDEAAMLLDWGFENFENECFLRAGQAAAEIPVTDGMERIVPAIAARALTVPVGLYEESSLALEMEPNLRAPVRAGTVVGRAFVEVDGLPCGEVMLLAGRDIEALGFFSSLRKLARQFNPIR